MRLYSIYSILGLCISVTHGICPHEHGRTAQIIREPRSARCDPRARYRSPDGQCNNLENPLWGSTFVILDRVVQSAYDDNVNFPRTKDSWGRPLSTAREISLKCHPPNGKRSSVSLMVMQWGQFLDHDITLTPHSMETEHHPVACECGTTSKSCFNIPLRYDNFFKRQCFPFVRSGSVQATDHIHKWKPIRQQTNAITGFIDASNVYGSSLEEMSGLRRRRGGELIESSQELLPKGDKESCSAGSGQFCFLAGDSRVNEQPGLASMHTVFMREHNRIARHFQRYTSWNDERTFQETRKIIGAIMQRITYEEFLPVVLGRGYLRRYDLKLSHYRYDRTLKPNLMNVFSTAAFRFGHSLIPDEFNLSFGRKLPLKDNFFIPSAVFSSVDELITSIITDKSMQSDRNFAHSVTRHLFESIEGVGKGFDLVSLNIQRGRDHGLPSYNKYREFCGFRPIGSLRRLFKGDRVAASAYRHIDDVDIFTGGMAEPTIGGGIIGKTFNCLISKQFQRLKSGDRFFYLNKDDSNVRFTDAQIQEINKVSLASILCQNTKVQQIQENVFLPASTWDRKPCHLLPKMDLNVWSSNGSPYWNTH